MKRTVCIIQARMGSTRLPGKVMKTLSGKTVLWHVITRLKQCRLIDEIVVATTSSENDKIIKRFCEENHFSFFVGDEFDVMGRYLDAAHAFSATTIIRITSDCPLIDPFLVDEMLRIFNPINMDYLSNILPPRTYPKGLDTEIFTTLTLEDATKLTQDPQDREHVTPYIMNHPEKFRLIPYYHKIDLSNERWTLDTQEDFEFIEKIYNALYTDTTLFASEDILTFLKSQQITS